MTKQAAPAATDNTLPFSLEYAHEWFLRFGDETPISGDAIRAYKNKASYDASFSA